MKLATALKQQNHLSCKLELHNDYLVADIEGSRCLIDTGSPVTIGDGPFKMMGREFQTVPSYGPCSVAELGKQVGTHLDYLVGLDVLREFPWDVDLEGEVITFYLDCLPTSVTGHWLKLDCGSFMGAPILNFTLNGKELRGILDTGAPTQYAPPDADLGPVDQVVDDFFPGVGWFKATHHKATFKLGNRTIAGGFGKFPPDSPLASWHTWILGSDVLKSGPIAFDLQNRSVYLC